MFFNNRCRWHGISFDQLNSFVKVFCSISFFNKEIIVKILCLRQTIGSTTGGLVLQTAARRGLAPAAMLFADEIDPLAASGVILSNVWEKVPLICIDGLGREFLDTVKTGDQIEIKEDGTVVIL